MPTTNTTLSPGDTDPSIGGTYIPSPTNQPTSPQQPIDLNTPPPIPNPTIYGNGVGLISSFDKTDLDTENPNINGGIPYQQAKDPTQYPPTTQAFTPIPGYFATGGKGASKFYQKWASTRTYLDYMSSYT
jgi:hypothetical protein